MILALSARIGPLVIELDSHMDSLGVRKNVHIVEFTGEYVNLSEFIDKLVNCNQIPVVNCKISFPTLPLMF